MLFLLTSAFIFCCGKILKSFFTKSDQTEPKPGLAPQLTLAMWCRITFAKGFPLTELLDHKITKKETSSKETERLISFTEVTQRWLCHLGPEMVSGS